MTIQMKIRDFMKWIRYVDADGNLVEIEFTDDEIKIMELAEELKVEPYIRVGGRPSSFKFEINPIIKEKL
jgi:hypothetical protein